LNIRFVNVIDLFKRKKRGKEKEKRETTQRGKTADLSPHSITSTCTCCGYKKKGEGEEKRGKFQKERGMNWPSLI